MEAVVSDTTGTNTPAFFRLLRLIGHNTPSTHADCTMTFLPTVVNATDAGVQLPSTERSMKTFTLRELLLATATITMAAAWIVTSIKLAEKDAELQALTATSQPAFHHPTAHLRLVSVTDPTRRSSTLPLASPLAKQMSGNYVHQTVPAAPAVQLSVVARHLGSTDDGDVYEIFWSEQGRLPPVPQSRNFPDTSKIVQTGRGVVQVYESDQWKIEIADRFGP
jgi:hypothetical protein